MQINGFMYRGNYYCHRQRKNFSQIFEDGYCGPPGDNIPDTWDFTAAW